MRAFLAVQACPHVTISLSRAALIFLNISITTIIVAAITKKLNQL
jgi:hypothetical protein